MFPADLKMCLVILSELINGKVYSQERATISTFQIHVVTIDQQNLQKFPVSSVSGAWSHSKETVS
jgi:hypothetical protein